MGGWSEARTFQDPQSASEVLDRARSVGIHGDLLDPLNPAIIITDVFGAITHWNRQAEALYGWTRDEVLGRNVRELVFEGPDADAAEAILATLAGGGTWEGEFNVRRKDGKAVRVVVSDAPIHDGDGILVGFVGVSFDLGRRVRTERRLAEALMDSDARKRAVLESALDAIVMMDAGGRIAEFNPAAERIFGFRRADVIGKEMATLIVPPALREAHRRGLRRYLVTGRSRLLGKRLELTGYRADGTEFPVELGIVRVDVAGPPLFTGYIRDITERRRAEDDRHRAQQGLAVLAEASDVLTASLDQEAMLSSLARLAVPRLATWCAIHVRSENGAISDVATAHADPERELALGELTRQAMDPLVESAVAQVLRTGQAVFHPEVNERTFSIKGTRGSDMHARVFEDLEVRSVMIVPLSVGGKSLGAITLARSATAPPYDHRDLALAHDLAHRAATAMDNARINSERDYIAQTLQQSLLPPKLPAVPGVTLAARYRPAGAGNEVGGDFYDIFQTASNVWIVVIGDVCGKGAEAAALTGLARHTLRAAAMRQSRPTRILATLNQALLDQAGGQRFCTVCCARVKRTSGRIRVTVSSGGHPLPLLLRADGSLLRLGTPGTLLGVFPDPDLTDESLDLAAEDALVLYTDGVTEERAAGVVFSEARLESIVRSCAGAAASELAERIERAVLDFQPDPPKDDLAVLVLQVPRGA